MVKATSWEESVRDDLRLVLDEYKAAGITKFGIFGFSFGGSMAAMATNEYYDDIRIAAHFHTNRENVSHAYGIQSPTILLPGASDPDMVSTMHNLSVFFCIMYVYVTVNINFW